MFRWRFVLLLALCCLGMIAGVGLEGQAADSAVSPDPSIPYPTTLSRFGSRVAWQFDAPQQKVNWFPLGRKLAGVDQMPLADELVLAVVVDGETRTLPLNSVFPPFESVTQRASASSINYTASSPGFPIEVSAAFSTSFYPQDYQGTMGPTLSNILQLKNIGDEAIKCQLIVAVPVREDAEPEYFFNRWVAGMQTQTTYQLSGPQPQGLSDSLTVTTGFAVHQKIKESVQWHGHEDPWHLTGDPADGKFAGFTVNLNLEPNRGTRLLTVFGSWIDEPVMLVEDQPARLAYTSLFPDGLSEALEYATKYYLVLVAKMKIIDDLIGTVLLDNHSRHLLLQAFHEWTQHTWCLDTPQMPVADNQGGLIVFENPTTGNLGEVGMVYYHGVPLLMLWPQLVHQQIQQWWQWGQVDRAWGRGVAGAIGTERVIGMPVDEHLAADSSLSVLQLSHAYWQTQSATHELELEVEMLRQLTQATGLGSQDAAIAWIEGLDEEQLYLPHAPAEILAASGSVGYHLKALGALLGVREMLMGTQIDTKLVMDSYSRSKTLRRLLLNQGLSDTGTWKLSADNDQPSIATFYGLLYPLRANLPLALDDLGTNLEKTWGATQCPGGFGYLPNQASPASLTQCLWTDLIGVWLGLDSDEHSALYWNTSEPGTRPGESLCGPDSPTTWQNDPPLGALALFGLPEAIGKLRVNQQHQWIMLDPSQRPWQVPIYLRANWKDGFVPWVVVHDEHSDKEVNVVQAGELKGYQIIVGKVFDPLHIQEGGLWDDPVAPTDIPAGDTLEP